MLTEHRRSGVPGINVAPSAPARAAFFFDPGCPFSYLAAERVERVIGRADWVPVPGAAMSCGSAQAPAAQAELRAAAERRAAELRLPLVWPECFPAAWPGAVRAAAYAAEAGAGPAFALAALRMAFCGGFDLRDPQLIGEVAAASGLCAEACLAAFGDSTRDAGLYATASALRMRGASRLPVIKLAAAVKDAEAVFAERLLASPA